MSIRIFKNNEGKSFTEVTKDVYKAKQRGWWYDIEKGDFDNDGDMDLIVGNLGLNYKYHASASYFDVLLNVFVLLQSYYKNRVVLGNDPLSDEVIYYCRFYQYTLFPWF